MKRNDNSLYLGHMLRVFESTIEPELTSETAKLTAGIMKQCLAELAKREGQSLAVMASSNMEGSNLVAEMMAQLGQLGIAAQLLPLEKGPGGDFRTLSDFNGVLTKQISLLSRQLSQATDTSGHNTALIKRAAKWEYQLHTALQTPLETPHQTRSENPLTREKLESFLQGVHPQGGRVRVENMKRVEGGFGKQTSFFTLVDGGGQRHELVVRQSDPNPFILRDAFIVEYEFHLLKAVAETGFLAPLPLWLGKEVPSVDGDFFIMRRMPGKLPGSLLGGAESIPRQYLLDVAEQLARLHAIPLEHYTGFIQRFDSPLILEETIEQYYRRNIAEWRDYAVRASDRYSPVLEFFFDWLNSHIPAHQGRPILIHGDFNIHNMLAENGRLSAVLDWEMAMFGAPEQDLAYIRPHIIQHIAWDDFVDHYEQCSGRTVDSSSLDFYLAYQCMRVLTGFGGMTENFQAGVITEPRVLMVELGFINHFMNLGMACCK